MAFASNLASSAEIERPSEHIIDLLRGKEIEPSLWLEECCIYKVPENLRNVNEKAYTPQLMSIGPIHHDLRKLKPIEKEEDISDFKHFTDLKRCYYIPPQLRNKNGGQCATEEPERQLLDKIVGQFKTKVTEPFRNCKNCDDDIRVSATKLNAAGVSFITVDRDRRKFYSSGSSSAHAHSSVAQTPLYITFKKKPLLKRFPWLSCLSCSKWAKARFEFQQLIVDGGTECIFRNLMVFEQWQYPNEAYVCNYSFFLDSLIDTTKDVDLLVENKVIVNELGSNEDLRDLFNKLCKQVVFTTQNDCYGDLVKELHEHYDDRWNHNMATLKSVYFCDPWRSSSTVVWIAVLIMTVASLDHSIF